MSLTRVEQYVISKGWDYRHAGSNIAVEFCPFCGGDGYKFFINTDNFFWDCKRPACPSAAFGKKGGGNELVLKRHMGDKMEQSTTDETVVAQKERGETKVEGIPDYEQGHQWLLENTDLMNYLNDERGWDYDMVTRMKLGMMNRPFIKKGEDGEKVKKPNTDKYVYEDIGCFTYPYIINGKCQFVKFRTLPGQKKDFSGLAGRDMPLYNQDVIKAGMDYLVLCEGEADTISVLMLGEENVVGVPGAGSKKVDWTDLLDYPGRLYLLFDNDEDGQIGAKTFAERFGIDKFHNIVIPEFDLIEPIEDKHGLRTKGKDITEWIMAGNGPEEFAELLSSAEQFALDGVYTARKALGNLRQETIYRGNNLPKYDTPWESLNKCFGGAEDGQLIIIQGQQKYGKTSLALDWADYLTDVKNVNVLFECLEMTESALVRKWSSYVTNTDDTPGVLKFDQLLEMLDKADNIAKQRESEILFGYASVSSLEQQFERMRSIIRRYNIKVWFFDNLQYLVDKLYEGQKQGNRANYMGKVTKMFKSLAMETKTLGVLIAQTKGIGDDDVATASSLEGSRSPGNDCDTMWIMNRTKMLPIKSKEDLNKMATYGDNTLTTATLNPELFIEVGLTRFAAGGHCILMIDGSRSKVYERDVAATLAAKQVTKDTTRIGGMVIHHAKQEAVADEPEVEVTI